MSGSGGANGKSRFFIALATGKRQAGLLSAVLVTAIMLSAPAPAAAADPADTVRAREQAFADSMAERDFDAFRSFLSEEAVFWSGDTVDRGKSAVAARWAAFFDGPEAPFSWRPEQVEVLASGALAFSSGPVFDGAGIRTATYHSVWRLEKDGQWRIVFDKGARWCPPSAE
jgi:ketosteroid isomerase-like protein